MYFTKSRLGKITLGKAPDNVTLTDGESGGKIEYVLTLPNLKYRQVSVWKTGLDHDTISTGAAFTLYRAEDYDDGREQPAHDAVAVTTGTTGTNGILYLGSLAPGNYRLVETKAPDGYNKAGQAIRITVGATGVSAMQGTGISEVSTKGDEHWVSGQGDDTYQIRVWNNPGVALPYTGGIGTTLFYVLGSILTAGSAVLMIARRRIRTAGRKY